MATASILTNNSAPMRALVGALQAAAITDAQPQSLGSPMVTPPTTANQPASSQPGNTTGANFNIVFDVVSEEQHTDEIEITDHPVEQGSVISDNAYKKPSMVVLTCGYSESGGLAGDQRNNASIRTLYNLLLAIQSGRNPFTVYTGKRVYPNMLLKSIATRSDDKNEHALPLTLVCREIIIAQTSLTNVTTDQAKIGIPELFTPVTSTGSKQLASAPLYVPLDSELAGTP